MARPHGLRGQVVVELLTNRVERVAVGAKLQGPTGELEVVRASPQREVGWSRPVVGIFWRHRHAGSRPKPFGAPMLSAATAVRPRGPVGPRADRRRGGRRCQGRRSAWSKRCESNPASDLLVLSGGVLIPLRFVVHHQPGRLTVDLPPGLLDL